MVAVREQRRNAGLASIVMRMADQGASNLYSAKHAGSCNSGRNQPTKSSRRITIRIPTMRTENFQTGRRTLPPSIQTCDIVCNGSSWKPHPVPGVANNMTISNDGLLHPSVIGLVECHGMNQMGRCWIWVVVMERFCLNSNDWVGPWLEWKWTSGLFKMPSVTGSMFVSGRSTTFRFLQDRLES